MKQLNPICKCECIVSITQQEGWLSPTERASVSAISLRQNLATSRESRRYVVAFTRFAGGSIWLRQESLRHILASPGTIAVNVTRLERGFNASKTPRCIYPSIFNRFWDIASYWSKSATFSYLCLAAPRGCLRRNFAKILINTKLEWMGYCVVKKAWQYRQPFWYNTSVWETDGRTDRHTDVQPIAKTCFSIADARKKRKNPKCANVM